MAEYNFSAPTTFQDAWKGDSGSSDEDEEITDSSFFGLRKSFILPKNRGPVGPSALVSAIGKAPGSPFFQRSNNGNASNSGATIVSAKAHRKKPSFNSLHTLKEVSEVVTVPVTMQTAMAPLTDENAPITTAAAALSNPPVAAPIDSTISEAVALPIPTANFDIAPVSSEVVTGGAEIGPPAITATTTSSIIQPATDAAPEPVESSGESSEQQQQQQEQQEQQQDLQPKPTNSAVASTPSRERVAGYLRGTVASTSKRRGSEQFSATCDSASKPEAKMSRLTRSGTRGLTSSSASKAAPGESVRVQKREEAIRAASAHKPARSVSLTSSVSRKPPSATIAAQLAGASGARKVTQPVAFNFGTSSRGHSKSADEQDATSSSAEAGVAGSGINDPFSLGRSYSTASNLQKPLQDSNNNSKAAGYKPAPLTKPVAFNLATAVRANARKGSSDVAAAAVEFKSTKQLVEAFQHKTPARFHSKSRLENQPELPEKFDTALTVPVRGWFVCGKVHIFRRLA
jgi:hypothetical protein